MSKENCIHNIVERRVGNPACTKCAAEFTPEYSRPYMDAVRDCIGHAPPAKDCPHGNGVTCLSCHSERVRGVKSNCGGIVWASRTAKDFGDGRQLIEWTSKCERCGWSFPGNIDGYGGLDHHDAVKA